MSEYTDLSHTNFPDIAAEYNTLDAASADSQRPLLRLRDRITVLIRELREHQRAVDACLIQHIEANGAINISDTESLYVGNTKTIKSTDDQGILMAILEVGNGNLELLTTGSGGMLCSQPWKHGAVRKLIGEERFEALFTTTINQDLNTGKATRSLKTYDSQLVYKR